MSRLSLTKRFRDRAFTRPFNEWHSLVRRDCKPFLMQVTVFVFVVTRTFISLLESKLCEAEPPPWMQFRLETFELICSLNLPSWFLCKAEHPERVLGNCSLEVKLQTLVFESKVPMAQWISQTLISVWKELSQWKAFSGVELLKSCKSYRRSC